MLKVAASRAGPQLLFVGRSLNMQSTADQALSRVFPGSTFIVTDIVARRASGGTSVACAGGVYDAASKGGNAVVGVAQSWVALTALNKIVVATLAAVALTDAFTASLILSLTTGSTAAATADVYVYGYNLDL